MRLDMIIGAVVAGLLIVSLFLEMMASAPRPAEERERRVPHAK
jgi:hypothetical protein